MTLLIICLVAALVSSGVANQDVQEDDGCLQRVEACNNALRILRRPVCGTNNLTYLNRCQLLRAQCQGIQVTIKHQGNCKDTQRCSTDRHYAERIPRPPQVELFIPTCQEDGSYAPVQCHAETGYCWCVNAKGKPIPNTSVRHNRPNCARKGKSGTKRRSSGGRKHKKGCGRNERTSFINNLIHNFKAEYNRRPGAGNMQSLDGEDTDMLERAVLDWKFGEMDLNNDTFLSKPEYTELKRLVRKVVRPRKCAKMFPRMCDRDTDKKISREEWSACLGLNFNPNDCLSDQKTALEEQKAGTTGLYIPECTPDGRYKKIQCYNSTGYCWCVYEDTGVPIPGTSIKDQNPNCDVVPPPARPMNGCPEPRKQAFLRDFMEFMKKKMAETKSKNPLESDTPPSGGPDENVATWAFHFLDKNKNKIWERKEWKALRSMVNTQPQLRRCGKRLPRYCDVIQDQKISLTEWLNCLSTQRITAVAVTANPSVVTNRTGSNPLRLYLDPD